MKVIIPVLAAVALVTWLANSCVSRSSNNSLVREESQRRKHYTKSTEPSPFDRVARKVMKLYQEKTGDITFTGEIRSEKLLPFDDVILEDAGREGANKVDPSKLSGQYTKHRQNIVIDRYIVLSRFSRLIPETDEEAKLIDEFRRGEINALSWLLNSYSRTSKIKQPEQLFTEVDGLSVPVALRFYEPDYGRLYLFHDRIRIPSVSSQTFDLRAQFLDIKGLPEVLGNYVGLKFADDRFIPGPVLSAEEAFRLGLNPIFYLGRTQSYMNRPEFVRYPPLNEIPNHPEGRPHKSVEKKDPPEFIRAMTTESEVIEGFRVVSRLSRKQKGVTETGLKAIWRTYDFGVPDDNRETVLKDPKNPKNILYRPLWIGMNRGGDERVLHTDFEHDAGEWIGVLPNGLHVYSLTQPVSRKVSSFESEKEITAANPAIAPYKDIEAVTSPYHCMHCHRNGLIKIDNYDPEELINLPQFTTSTAQKVFDRDAQRRIRAELSYLLKSAKLVQKVIQRDNKAFLKAKKQAFPYPKGYQLKVDLMMPFYLMVTKPEDYLELDGSPLQIE